jgi:NitT/TauT family transport system substrate-binding protein
MQRVALLLAVILLSLLSACSNEPDGGSNPRLTLQLNWVPEPEFGGYYAARELGAFKEAGLNLDIRPGGPGVPVMQLVASGQATFGITSGDSLLVARERGIDVVAVFALYQSFPQGIMAHAERDLQTIADVFQGGTLAIEAGTPWHRLLEKRFGFSKIKAVPYSNNLGPFLHDPNFAQQCFITAEPIAARHAGAHPRVFPISDIGYNPYSGVIVTRREFLERHPDQIAALIRAVRRGWEAYLADPVATNQLMHGLNPTMNLATFSEAAAIQKPLILGENPSANAIGGMDLARWRTLAEQLRDLGLISRVEPEAAFVNP